MKVKDVMCKQVEYIVPTTTLEEAAKKMEALDCGFLAIGEEEQDKLTGVITDRDIAIRSVAKGDDPKATVVEAVKTPKVLYCFQDDSIEDAAKNMHDNQVYRLIVLNNEEEKRLRGVITLGDIVRHNEIKAAEYAAKGISAKQQSQQAA